MTDKNELAQIGVVGLAVMGSNLARNFARNGNTVAVYNRSPEKTHALIEAHGEEGNFVPSETIEGFVASLERPRKAIIMVKAGKATDAVIDQLAEAMDDGDIIIDGGNALFTDTIRREKDVAARGKHFVGAGRRAREFVGKAEARRALEEGGRAARHDRLHVERPEKFLDLHDLVIPALMGSGVGADPGAAHLRERPLL